MPDLTPDAAHLAAGLEALSTFVQSAQPGWTRQVFSEPYLASREWTFRRMVEAGLSDVHQDAAGNIVGRLPGQHPELKPLMTGSHTDTVWGGGRFDGMVGVVGAIEAARLIRESGRPLARDLIVVDFLGEEANEFGLSCLGSRAITGELTPGHLDRLGEAAGATLGATMAGFGLDPDQALRLAQPAGSLHAYIELHIEQGPLLEAAGKEIGVVTAIAGIERLLAAFQGRGDHAGTMPMADRHDALLAAAEAVLAVEHEACCAPVHAVSTTGRIEALPGAFNVVPDSARIWAEVRSIDPAWLGGVKGRLAQRIAGLAAARGVETALEWLNDQPPVATTPAVRETIAQAAEAVGASWEAVPSGAGHDAAHLPRLGPIGMIFVPSQGGRSHVPEEFTTTEDTARGVQVLTQTLIALDAQPAIPA
ncbi:MAG: M20 family metallo-hydrolase [Bifidobacteriaceae bacterium]|jgi:N-carbamoyl-L-amino-acid hydrolase|nr:M20 family metallo-hydrolase [Bifidobacteriaceae bacterium]